MKHIACVTQLFPDIWSAQVLLPLGEIEETVHNSERNSKLSVFTRYRNVCFIEQEVFQTIIDGGCFE